MGITTNMGCSVFLWDTHICAYSSNTHIQIYGSKDIAIVYADTDLFNLHNGGGSMLEQVLEQYLFLYACPITQLLSLHTNFHILVLKTTNEQLFCSVHVEYYRNILWYYLNIITYYWKRMNVSCREDSVDISVKRTFSNMLYYKCNANRLYLFRIGYVFYVFDHVVYTTVCILLSLYLNIEISQLYCSYNNYECVLFLPGALVEVICHDGVPSLAVFVDDLEGNSCSTSVVFKSYYLYSLLFKNSHSW